MLIKIILTVFPLLLLTSCVSEPGKNNTSFPSEDSLQIIEMVNQREKAMIDRDIDCITQQFDSNANFINGGGYIYQGLSEIKNFHNIMFANDSLTYTYRIGKILIKPIREDVALVYYPWQQQWTLKNVKSDTLNEVGLMTIIASRENRGWKWKAITNQRTKEYFDNLMEHKAKAIH